ncbi:mannose-6-phosphate isomerase [Candidatus Peregrinibacteria bacterium CG10_big_fil_rev_8_21_14_0_10_49_24]|nr:MAG: mannose-6-phosphate isomerase [Candidatus Peregrinibacteria bacterium CG11_big_fil_rev_8_21_14_0_20_49_14]PIR51227.1 MAG: mannose-6-phosphate isomerase [Candidatus Peregrinibacteria bacterium CG10_big_fil_rev_8_21_14_0_10_49_24]PJA67265.1 MAG: mannose-6-phosphate isomerase [Candidatus Peregrinibacteria bacterium CG_4_9_14_3_um_filter_49_12]
MNIPVSHACIEEHIGSVTEPWDPIEIVRYNDSVVRLAKFEGEYHWHDHEQDELFYVYRGEIVIQCRDREDLNVKEGEMAVIPRGVFHCPKSTQESYVLLFEPLALDVRGGR